ncbi:MAG: hypothetical protein IKR71_03040, partial [Bacteroidales bacterium]|nr:hypothetical protein [Bacteroidales bacterium]
MLVAHYEHFERLTEADILNITAAEDDTFFRLDQNAMTNDVILHGREGKVIKALTPNQRRLVESANH